MFPTRYTWKLALVGMWLLSLREGNVSVIEAALFGGDGRPSEWEAPVLADRFRAPVEGLAGPRLLGEDSSTGDLGDTDSGGGLCLGGRPGPFRGCVGVEGVEALEEELRAFLLFNKTAVRRLTPDGEGDGVVVPFRSAWDWWWEPNLPVSALCCLSPEKTQAKYNSH